MKGVIDTDLCLTPSPWPKGSNLWYIKTSICLAPMVEAASFAYFVVSHRYRLVDTWKNWVGLGGR